MTHPDLERELGELLQCPHEPPCEDPRVIQDACPSCAARPAILSYVQRKLDEAKAEYDDFVAAIERGGEAGARAAAAGLTKLYAELDEARADSELLAKVEKLLHDDAGLRIDTCAGGVLVKRSAPFGLLVYRTVIGSPLREALRKLVEEES